MKLNQIADNVGSRKPRKRVGRGASSGLGKTSGKGQKGQKSRSGVAINGFEGGQMPIYRRLPKRGFTNIFRKQYREINLGNLQTAIDAKKIDASKTVNIAALQAAGLIKTPKDGVRLLAKGDLNAKSQDKLANKFTVFYGTKLKQQEISKKYCENKPINLLGFTSSTLDIS